MAQKRVQKYNPVTRKYEWITVDAPNDSRRISPPKSPEHKQIVDWVKQFDSSVAKLKRTNDDYAFLIRKIDGTDVTPAVLNDAKSKGLIDDANYRKRLKQYQDARAELGRTPMVDDSGKVITYRNRVTNKEQPMMRSMWLDNGNYNFNQSFDQVANKASTKREALVKEQTDFKEPSHVGNTFANLGAVTRGTYNRKTVPDVVKGAQKGYANSVFNVVGALEAGLNKADQSLFEWNNPLTGGKIGSRLTPEEFNQFRAGIVNTLYDPVSTPEEKFQLYGNILAGNTDPRSQGQAVGMEAGNFLGNLYPGLAVSAAAGAEGGPWGSAAAMIGQTAGGVAELFTGDPRYNFLGNPSGAVARAGGEYNRSGEESLNAAHQQAYATGPLMLVAGLTTALVTKNVGAIANAGNYRAGLKEAVKGVKALQATAAAGPEVNAIAAGAKGMGLPLAPKPTAGQAVKSFIQTASPLAVEGVVNTAVTAVQVVASMFNPNMPAPTALDFATGLGFGVLGRAPKDTVPGMFNELTHNMTRDGMIKRYTRDAAKSGRDELASKVPLYKHLMQNYNMSSDQALAYMSHEFEAQHPGFEIPRDMDAKAEVLNTLPSAQRLEANSNVTSGDYQMVVDPNITALVNAGKGLTAARMEAQLGKRRQESIFPEPPTQAEVRPEQARTLEQQINPGLKPFSMFNQELQTRVNLLKARNELVKPAITPESGAEQLQTNKRQIPLASMVIDTNEGPRKIMYSHDLSKVYASEDLSMPTHELHKDAYEIGTGHFPKENLADGVAFMNNRDNASVRWSLKEPDGTIVNYDYVGFKGGQVVVRRSINDVATLHTLTSRELGMASPETQQRVNELIDGAVEQFKSKRPDDGREESINYTQTSFAKANRDLFPSTIYEGKSTRGNRGALPARKISGEGAFNTYQLPDGAVIRVSKIADTPDNKARPVMSPIDTRMETVIGSRYSQDLLTQSSVKDHPGFYEVSLADGTERTIYVSAALQAKIKKEILDPAKDAMFEAGPQGEDLAQIRNDANSAILKRLLNISRTGTPKGDTVDYNYGYTDTPVTVGDVVQFIHHEKEGKTRPSSVLNAGHERGVVVDIDQNGVHVKLANQLPGLIEGEGGRSVIVHPDNLQPIIQPHLGGQESNMRNIVDVADLDADFGYGPKKAPESPEVVATDEVIAMPPDPEGEARLQGEQTAYVTTRLLEEGTVEHVRKTILDVAQDKTIDPRTLQDSVVNLLNGDDISYGHKETIIHGLLSMDLDAVNDLGSIVKINHTLDGVSQWLLSENRPFNLMQDYSTMMSGDVVDKVIVGRTQLEHAGIVLNSWNKGTVKLSTVLKRYFESTAGSKISPEDRVFITKQTVAMSQVIPQLRTYLNGRGLMNSETWNRVARLSIEDQRSLYEKAIDASRRGTDTAKNTARLGRTDIDQLMLAANVKPRSGQLPKANNVKYDKYASMISGEVAAYKRQVNSRGSQVAVVEIQKTNGMGNIANVNEFLKSLDTEGTKEIRQQVMSELAKQNITESDFTALFSGLRFPGQEVTVGEIASHIKNGTLPAFVDASNQMRGATMQLSAMDGATLQDLQDIFMPFNERVSDDVKAEMDAHVEAAFNALTAPRNERATAGQRQLSFVNSLNDAVTLGLRHIAGDPSLVKDYVDAARVQYNKISSKTIEAMRLSAQVAEAQAKTAGMTKPRVTINEGVVSELKNVAYDLGVENASEKPPHSRISQDEYDSIRATHEEANQWLKDQKVPRLTNVIVELPLSDVPGISASTAEGRAVEITGEMANGRDALVVAFKNAMDMKNMRPEVKVIVEQMAEAYADAYDLHAYSYAARHAEYEFKTGRVEASNMQVLEILEVAKRLATTDERRIGIESLIKRVEDGVSLFTAKEKSYENEIIKAFPNDAKFGEKLSTYIYTSRVAKLQSEFYRDNGRLVVAASELSSNVGSAYMNFASLTADGLNGTADRAAVNMLLHLNRTSNRSRDILSIGHELHHGFYHTMPLIKKLQYAQDVLGAIMNAHGLKESQGKISGRLPDDIKDIASVYKLVTTELDAIKTTRDNLEALATRDPTTENVNNLELFNYKNSIDMHGDTNHWLYKNTLVNEAVVSSLITGSMGMKPVYDNANFTVAYTASGVFARIGGLINKAVQTMSKNGRVLTDYRVTSRDGFITDAQHRWKIKYDDHFVARNKDGKAIAFSRLPENAQLSFLVAGRKGLPLFPTYELTNPATGVLKPTTKATVVNTEATPPMIGKLERESAVYNVYANYVTFKPESQSLSKLSNVEPSFTLDGQKYYKLDTKDGIALDSVRGVTIERRYVVGDAYGVVNSLTNDKTSISIIKPEQLLGMSNVRVSGDAPGWTPNLSSLLYSMYGKTNALASSASGQLDWATYSQMKTRVAKAGVDIDRMPNKNISSMDVGQVEYATTAQGKAAITSSIDALNTMRRQAADVRDTIVDYIDNSYEQAEHQKQYDAISEAVDGLRRSLFGLDQFDFPLKAQVLKDGKTTDQYVPSILTSESGNTRAMDGMFHVTKENKSTPSMEVVRDVAQGLRSTMSDEQLTSFANAILDSHDLNSFQRNLLDYEKYGMDETTAINSLGILGESIEKISGRENVLNEVSPDEVMHNLRTMVLGSQDAVGRNVDIGRFGDILDRVSSTDSEMTPNISGQREFILTAANAAAKSQNKHVVDFIKSIQREPAGIDAATMLATTHAMSIDVANRSSAMRSYNQWELAGTQYFGSRKAPYLILRSKGVEGRYSQDLGSPSSSKVLHIAVDQVDSSIRSVTPIRDADGNVEYIIVKRLGAKESSYGGFNDYGRIPETTAKNINEVNWLMRQETSKGDYKAKSTDSFEFDAWDGSSPLQQSLSNVNVVTHSALNKVIGTAVYEMGSAANAVKTSDVTLPFYVHSGVDATGQFSGTYKPSSMIEVFNSLDAYSRKEDIPDGNLQLRHMKVRVTKTGDKYNVKFTDLGSIGATTNTQRQTLGTYGRSNNAGLAIAPVEAYIARHLLAVEAHKEANGQEHFFSQFETGEDASSNKTPLSRPAITIKKGQEPKVEPASTWKGWKGNSVFSDGYDPSEFIDHAQAPVNATEQSAIKDQAPGDVLVVHDTTLKPDEVKIDIDENGVSQVRGGMNKRGWHKAVSVIGTVLNETDGFFRTVKLSGDISVAMNQSWLLANPLTFAEHAWWAIQNKLSPGMALGPGLTAMGGAPAAILPNTPGLFAAMFKNSPIKMSKFGDDYVHMYMEKILSRTDLSLEEIEHYGLNLEYLKWHKEYRDAQFQDPNIEKSAVPLKMRLTDYYGDSKLAQKVIPFVQMKERFNALYKDLAALTEFQKRYIEVQGMFPSEKVIGGSIQQYRSRQLRDSAEAINIMQGMQRGEVSPNQSLAFFQRFVTKIVTSAKYRHSRLMLTPLVGRGLYAGKMAANKLSNKLGKGDIANTTYETKIFADAENGGFTPEVKAYVSRRLWQGFLASRAIQAATRGGAMITALGYLLNSDEEKRKEGATLLLDELVNSGLMKLDVLGHQYELPLPGGMASGIRQASMFTQQSPRAIANLPQWAWRQYIFNQMGPTAQNVGVAVTGKTFMGKDAFETNEEYGAWREQWIKSNSFNEESKHALELFMPRNLSRFVTEMGNVAFTDQLKDMALKREGRFARGNDISLTGDDVKNDYFKMLVNQFGGGMTDVDAEYEEWLKENVGGLYGSEKRWQVIKAQNEEFVPKNIIEANKTMGLEGVIFGEKGKDQGY